MTDQKLRLVVLQLATQATLNTGGTLEKAKEFYSWLSNEEGERDKEQEKGSNQFIISAREGSTLCDWISTTAEQVRKTFKTQKKKLVGQEQHQQRVIRITSFNPKPILHLMKKLT